MATEAFWQKTREKLFHPQLGVVRYVPMKEGTLVANGPMFANTDVVQLLVLGHQPEAVAVLDYVPRLETLIRANQDPTSNTPWRAQLCQLLPHLSFGIWLRTGAFDREIARLAFSTQHEWAVRAKMKDGPDLTSLLILALECDDDAVACQLYQTHHKAPLKELPDDKRLMAGPQHLLALTARFGKEKNGQGRLISTLMQFAARARHWDKRLDPVPYISIVPLTRILTQCLRRLGEPHNREDIWKLIR
jgi:hypothetical protein